jgi:excisionase family DNA binding protein
MHERKAISLDVSQRITVPLKTALDMLGVGRTTFYSLIAQGEIDVIKVGRSTLVVVASIKAFVEERIV